MSSLRNHAAPLLAVPLGIAIPTLAALGCGPPVDRREYGAQWVPPPDTLGGVDFDPEGETEEPTDEGPPPGDGPVDPPDHEPPPEDDGGADEGGIETTGPPAADTGDHDGGGESPYVGGWDVGDCQDEIVATGTQVGQVVPDFLLKDQFGDTVRLYDFCHQAVFLTAGAFW